MQFSGRQWLLLIVGILGLPVVLVVLFMIGGTLGPILGLLGRTLGRFLG